LVRNIEEGRPHKNEFVEGRFVLKCNLMRKSLKKLRGFFWFWIAIGDTIF
jgi:hypothetical protein